jgi:hypothetical protein
MEAAMEITGKNNKSEKRKAPRDDYPAPFHYETRGIEYIGFMRNVSIDGAFFDTSASLDIGQEVSLNIVLPERGFSYLRGDVLRLDPDGYGIKFQEII